MSVLNKGILDVEKVVSELYDPANCGVMSFPGFIDEEFRKRLEVELIGIGKRYEIPESVEGGVRQELASFDFFKSKERSDRFIQDFPRVLELQCDYIGVFQEIGRKAKFSFGGFNSTVATRYRMHALGIGYHRDYLSDKNLVSLFVVAGEAGFYVARSRSGLGKKEIESPPGSLILMRAPRNHGENDLRPIHKVGKIKKERYSLAIRQSIK